ncbi:hypothetical protein AMTR_s00150p00047270 [Amborella trichopoda]|uniref:Uncharacterized protein n=1 Tax=Amborella trichopoda TaxID=13333 RepID=W1PMP8_AMBTC|nr:hypothetical protein AMTR_s00150p00047270 [Amborella trichopoda]
MQKKSILIWLRANKDGKRINDRSKFTKVRTTGNQQMVLTLAQYPLSVPDLENRKKRLRKSQDELRVDGGGSLIQSSEDNDYGILEA